MTRCLLLTFVVAPKGVCFDKTKNQWIARIRVDGKNSHLGWFDCDIDAARAYDKAAAQAGKQTNFDRAVVTTPACSKRPRRDHERAPAPSFDSTSSIFPCGDSCPAFPSPSSMFPPSSPLGLSNTEPLGIANFWANGSHEIGDSRLAPSHPSATPSATVEEPPHFMHGSESPDGDEGP
jgi:hypothetical protein